ncbi:hypothetical protein [Streptomyces sp. NPDC058385]|uniref:hypothetical protein n=1 Tax=Streptomyces sp. NPDC058385 TaxID=3346473 RepID=UPI00365465A9
MRQCGSAALAHDAHDAACDADEAPAEAVEAVVEAVALAQGRAHSMPVAREPWWQRGWRF